MKKFFSLLAVMALVVMASSSVWATPAIVGEAKTAIANFTGGVLEFSADLFEHNSTYTGSAAENIAFDTSGVTLGSSEPKFVCASVYALIHSNPGRRRARSVHACADGGRLQAGLLHDHEGHEGGLQ